MTPVRFTRRLALAALLMATAAAAAAGVDNPLVEHVRIANNRFKDVKAAVAEGYAPIPCTSGPDGGAMGIHYVNPKLLMSETADLKHPAAVLYEPTAEGKLNLVAVEYVTVKGPAALEGHLFSFIGAPNRYGLPAFYELHVWAWKPNPKGVFTDMNPTVSCDHAREMQM
jgi:hypothetical protein